MRGIFKLIMMGTLLPGLALALPDANVMQLKVLDAHVGEAKAGASVPVGMVIRNPTSSTLVLAGASTPVAGQTLLQRYVTSGDNLVQMETLQRVVLAPGSETVLAPGGMELQLIGLTQNLEAGLEVPLTLKFADGTVRTVRLNVVLGE